MESALNLVKSAVYAVFVYLGMKTGTVKVLFYLMTIDSVLGIIKALRLGYSFSFKRLGWGMISKLSLLVVPMVLALIAKGLDMDFSLFVATVMNIIIVKEGISCRTNILSIKTKKNIENNDRITLLLNSLRKILGGILEKGMRTIEKQDKK